jgi:hypothetical protein
VDCSLSVYICIACAALLVDATPGSVAIPDVSALRRSRNFLIRSPDVVLGLFDSLDSALFDILKTFSRQKESGRKINNVGE